MSELLTGRKVLVHPGKGNSEPTGLSTFVAERQDFGAHGSLLPVVGPGCFQMSSHEEVPWDAMRRSLSSDPDPDPDVEQDLATFLRELWHERGDQRGRSPKGSPTSAEEDDDLSQVRRGLLRCAVLATKLFAAAVESSVRPVDSWQEHEVPLSLDAEGGKVIRELRRVAELADRLSDKERAWPIALLGAPAIASRLRRVADEAGRAESISGAVVEWLTDLTWHALVFTGGLAPSTEELAVQLSLVLGGGSPTTRVDPGHAVGAVGAAGVEQLSHQLGAIMQAATSGPPTDDHGEPLPASPRQRLYDGLAHYLFASSRSWTAAQERYRRLPQWPVPLVLTTNYDLQLEQALNDFEGPSSKRFHVVIPVYVFASQDDERQGTPIIKWLVATVVRRPGQAVERRLDWRLADDLASSPSPLAEDRSLAGLELEGPVVVKLNGSPMHQPFPSSLRDHRDLATPQPQAFEGFGGPKSSGVDSEAAHDHWPRLQHAVVFSEFEQLQHLLPPDGDAGGDALPKWLAEAMRQQGRNWVFLGQRLVDWNTRLRLFFDLYYRATKTRSQDVSAVAVNKRFNAQRSSLLRWLGIERVQGDLSGLVGHLHHLAAGCEQRYREDLVR